MSICIHNFKVIFKLIKFSRLFSVFRHWLNFFWDFQIITYFRYLFEILILDFASLALFILFLLVRPIFSLSPLFSLLNSLLWGFLAIDEGLSIELFFWKLTFLLWFEKSSLIASVLISLHQIELVEPWVLRLDSFSFLVHVCGESHPEVLPRFCPEIALFHSNFVPHTVNETNSYFEVPSINFDIQIDLLILLGLFFLLLPEAFAEQSVEIWVQLLLFCLCHFQILLVEQIQVQWRQFVIKSWLRQPVVEISFLW